MTSLQDVEPAGTGAMHRTLALAGRGEGTPDSFLAADVQAWIASPRQGLSAAIEARSGPDDAAGALARLAPSTMRIVAVVASERACWAELDRLTEDGAETCVLGLSYNDEGDVSRLIWLAAPRVPGSGINTELSAPDARPVIEAYFADLMGSRFRQAAAHFTADTIYSHPPYRGGSERVLFRGREALCRGLTGERGTNPVRQIITGSWQRQCRVFVEGVVEGIPNGGTFVSTAEITAEGDIARYVAFYAATRIPIR